MRVTRLLDMALGATLCLVSLPGSGAAPITGAGATFPYPVYAKWAEAYSQKTGVRLNYQSIGSGGGIKQIRAKTVDFGASDAPLKFEELEKDGLVQFPMVMGGVVPVVNVEGILPGKMSLTGKVLADIYLGKIRKWNDPVIMSLNPGLKLPSQDITVVHLQGQRRVEGEGWKRRFGVMARPHQFRRQGKRGRRLLCSAYPGNHRVRRVRLCQTEPDGLYAAGEQGRTFRGSR